MNNMTRSSVAAVTLLVLATFALPSSAESVQAQVWELPAGSTLVLAEDTCVIADEVKFDGTVLALPTADGNGASLSFVTKEFTMTGAFLGADGIDAADVAESTAPDGGQGSAFLVSADSISLSPTALVQTGAGGDGGAAAPVTIGGANVVTGGSGGDAGAIILDGAIQALPAAGMDNAGLFGNIGGVGGDASLPAGLKAATVNGGNGGSPGGLLTTDVSAMLEQPGSRAFAPTLFADTILEEILAIEDPCDVVDLIMVLIEGDSDGLCDGSDGADANTSGSPGTSADAADGVGASGLIGGAGPEGTDGNDGTSAAADAVGGHGTDGCWGGHGGKGGDAYATGGNGGDGGDGGDGGSGTAFGGVGGAGGNGGDGGDGQDASPGKGGCGGFLGSDGADGTGSALAGQGGFGGTGGGGGGSSLVPGAPGAPGATGSRGLEGILHPASGCHT